MVTVKMKNGKVSDHFELGEFFIHQEGEFNIPAEVIRPLVQLTDILEDVRAKLGKGLKVNSGCRSEAYNKKCGGIKLSNHRWEIHDDGSISCDVQIPFVNNAKAQEWIYFIQESANSRKVRAEVGIYDTFIHIGVNPTYTKGNYNWRKKNGVQTNNFYKNKAVKF